MRFMGENLRENLLFWLAVVLMAASQFSIQVYFFDLAWPWALLDASSAWLLLGIFLYGLIQAYSYAFPRRQEWLLFTLTPAVLTALWWLLQRALLFQGLDFIAFAESVSNFKFWYEEVLAYRLLLAFFFFSSGGGWAFFRFRLREELRLSKGRAEEEALWREVEQYKLRQQLQPHFLFNSLNSVNALLGRDPQAARRMIAKLSDFYRQNLQHSRARWQSLKAELDLMRHYLDIEKQRFGHRLHFQEDLGTNCLDWPVPALLLQPLVENAIKHGLYGQEGEVMIAFKAYCDKHYLYLELSNPMPQEVSGPKGPGYGLEATRKRLFLLYGQENLIQSSRESGTFCLRLKIPQQNVPGTDR